MSEDKTNYRLYFIGTIVIAIIMIASAIIALDQSANYDRDTYTVEGYLSGYKNDNPQGYHYILDNETHYCSEGFPSNFETYFGKHVKITGYSGCGRASIDKIEVIK